jgi:hypothetical protein
VSKNRVITDGKLPQRKCPVCGMPVVKTIRYGQLSYECDMHRGPWDSAVRTSDATTAANREGEHGT